MVALLSHIISSFRCIISSLIPSLSIRSHSSNVSPSLAHHWNIPLPHILHRELDQNFMNGFDEVLVIGDVHGCYEELIVLLQQISNNNNNSSNNSSNDSIDSNETNNNVNNDRILKLFVGDIVNKGPKSKEVLEFMLKNTDNCLSVRGNHDEVVIREYLKYETEGEQSLSDANKWIKDLTRNQIDYLISMSYTIRIPSLNLMVVHAGLVPGVGLESQKFEEMVNMRNVIMSPNNENNEKENQNCLKGISYVSEGEPWAAQWRGPEHVYFGHDAKRKLQINKFSTGLDTGCVYGGSLTSIFVSGLRKGTFFIVKANKIHSQPKGPIV